MVSLREAAVHGKAKVAAGKGYKKWTKHFVPRVCNDVLLEFKTRITEASSSMKESTRVQRRSPVKSTDEPGSGLCRIKMRGGVVVASTSTRQLYIQATGQSAKWIQDGLRSSVTKYLDNELGAMSHTSSSATANQVPTMRHLRAGVRDKIQWMPEGCRWKLHYKGDDGDDMAYCKEHNLNLAISTDLCAADFALAREEAFQNAWQVWNAVDQSKRQRLRLPGRHLDVQMRTVPYRGVAHTDSESESTQDDSDG